MKGKQQQDYRVEKYIRYGIRKYSFGAASVAVAAGLMFLGNGAVSATEVQGAEASVAATTAPANQADQILDFLILEEVVIRYLSLVKYLQV